MKTQSYLFVLLAVVLSLFGLMRSAPGNGEVVLVNNASDKIVEGYIEICGKRIAVGEIEKSGKKQFEFKITRDSHYQVYVKLQSGQQMCQSLGYLDRGTDFKDEIKILSDGMILEAVSVETAH